jgi:hypothetical protein
MTLAVVPLVPPTGFPEVVLTQRWTDEPDGAWPTGGEVVGGRLQLTTTAPGAIAAAALHPRPLRDVVIDVHMTIVAGDSLDMAGVYLRQGEPDRYMACGVGPGGFVGIVAVDGSHREPLVGGPIAGDLPFNLGVGAANRITIVACGPCITFLVNHAVVAGIAVDARYKEGHAGVLVADGGGGERAAAAVTWAEIRALLPGQP